MASQPQSASHDAAISDKAATSDPTAANSKSSNESTTSGVAVKKEAIWSPVGHFKSLFQPRGFAAMEGMRAILCFWMISFHSWIYMHYFVDDVAWKAMAEQPVMYTSVLGFVAVDGFFVLTGFLLGFPLFEAEAKKRRALAASKDKVDGGSTVTTRVDASFSVKEWLYRRIARMVPLYLLMLLVHCYIIFPKGHFPVAQVESKMELSMLASLFPDAVDFPNACNILPANLLFINNLIPFGGCMGYTWTFAIQFQFYLLLPLLWKWFGAGKKMLWAIAFVQLFSIASRTFSFLQLTWFLKGSGDGKTVIFAFFWYSFTSNRIGPIFTALAAAYISANWDMKALGRRYIIQLIATFLSIAALGSNVYWTLWVAPEHAITPGMSAVHSYTTFAEGYDHLLFYVFGLAGSPGCGFAFTYIMMAVIHKWGPIGQLMNAFFSLRIWYPFAQLSFVAYLVHPWMCYIQYPTFLYKPETTVRGWAIGTLCCYVLSFSTALVVYITVERPLELWLRQSVRGWLAKLSHCYSILLGVVSTILHVGVIILMLLWDTNGDPDAKDVQDLFGAK